MRYTDAHPHELDAAIARGAPAILPIGALEWHGPHLPLGLDGLVAEAFAETLAERVDGVLLPPAWWAATTLPHRLSLQVSAETFTAMAGDMCAALRDAGFTRVALISGHYAHPHELLLMDVAEAATTTEFMVLTAPPLALLGEPSYLDHAAVWETSQLLTVRPDLVRLEWLDDLEIENASEAPAQTAVLGTDPRAAATPAAGEEITNRALDTWEQALESLSLAWLTDFYARRRSDYDAWVDDYFEGDWDAALEWWWKEYTS